jgi:hypothetical protein
MSSPNGKMEIDRSPNHRSCVYIYQGLRFNINIVDYLTYFIVPATILLILCVPRGHTIHSPEKGRDAIDDETGTTTISAGVVGIEVARKVETSPATGRTEIERGVETGMEILA